MVSYSILFLIPYRFKLLLNILTMLCSLSSILFLHLCSVCILEILRDYALIALWFSCPYDYYIFLLYILSDYASFCFDISLSLNNEMLFLELYVFINVLALCCSLYFYFLPLLSLQASLYSLQTHITKHWCMSNLTPV